MTTFYLICFYFQNNLTLFHINVIIKKLFGNNIRGDDMYYMNKTKRNLIIAAGVLNIFYAALTLAMTIMVRLNIDWVIQNYNYLYILGYSTNLIYGIIAFSISFVGSILLFYAVREKGKYFRSSSGVYIAGVIIVILTGGWISWILLLVAAFTPDIIVINDKSDLRRDEKEQVFESKEYAEKKEKIEHLKKLRDEGAISEEEYKEKLFEIL